MAESRLRVGGGRSETDSDSHPRGCEEFLGRNSRWEPQALSPMRNVEGHKKSAYQNIRKK